MGSIFIQSGLIFFFNLAIRVPILFCNWNPKMGHHDYSMSACECGYYQYNWLALVSEFGHQGESWYTEKH